MNERKGKRGLFIYTPHIFCISYQTQLMLIPGKSEQKKRKKSICLIMCVRKTMMAKLNENNVEQFFSFLRFNFL